jgi:hypothetical protein
MLNQAEPSPASLGMLRFPHGALSLSANHNALGCRILAWTRASSEPEERLQMQSRQGLVVAHLGVAISPKSSLVSRLPQPPLPQLSHSSQVRPLRHRRRQSLTTGCGSTLKLAAHRQDGSAAARLLTCQPHCTCTWTHRVLHQVLIGQRRRGPGLKMAVRRLLVPRKPEQCKRCRTQAGTQPAPRSAAASAMALGMHACMLWIGGRVPLYRLGPRGSLLTSRQIRCVLPCLTA